MSPPEPRAPTVQHRAAERRRQRPNRRADVIEVASRLFAEHGYHGTSMRDLGNELGLLGSSVYAHIGSKDELLIELIREGADHFQSLADRVLASAAPPLDQLRALVAGHVAIVADHRDRVAVYLHEHRFLPEPHRGEAGALRDRYEGAFRTVLAAGAGDGTFRPDLDVDLDARLILSMLNALDRWYDPNGELEVEAVADAIWRLACDGVRRRRPEPARTNDDHAADLRARTGSGCGRNHGEAP